MLDCAAALLGVLEPFEVERLRLCDGCPEGDAARLTRAWCERWRAFRMGSDPERALTLLGPLDALRGAAVYASFVAQIEPTEQPFHADDVPRLLATAAALERR